MAQSTRISSMTSRAVNSETPTPAAPSTDWDWLEEWRTPEQIAASDKLRLQGAERLREHLYGVPFYAKRAQACKDRTGSETEYWLDLLGSRPTWPMASPLMER